MTGCDTSFDYDLYWSVLEAMRRPMLQPDGQRRVALREWIWPPLRPYNGFKGEERVRGGQIGRWLKDVGLLAWPTTCDLCGAAGANCHSENYYDPLSDAALCRACHGQVHRRFTNPMGWATFVEASLSRHDRFPPGSQPWFSLLPCHDIDLAGYVRQRFGRGVLDLLNSPLYHLPDGFPPPLG